MVLLTSEFEGVPYVAFEAMAMGTPVIAPALPGTRELLAGGGGVLVDPRDEAEGYAARIDELAARRNRASTSAHRSTARARGAVSRTTMASQHEQLYERCCASGPGARAAAPPSEPSICAPLRFRRRTHENALVSIVIPCFNHGRYLRECLAAIAAQTWPRIETIVVDDASTDDADLRLLDGLEGVTPDQRWTRTGGPSSCAKRRHRARERALRAPGRCRQPPPPERGGPTRGAAAEAGEHSRLRLSEPAVLRQPARLLRGARVRPVRPALGNFCDTCSLFDADIFAGGHGFDESIGSDTRTGSSRSGWQNAGFVGEPARAPTLLYRKSGFTRSDLVEHGREAFAGVVRERHPASFGMPADEGRWGIHSGPAVAIKARWSPGLSLIALTAITTPSETARRLAQRLAGQSFQDAELLARVHGPAPDAGIAPRVRRIPAALAQTPAEALQDGLREALAPFLLITHGTSADLLRDPAFLEKLLRALLAHERADAIVLADAGEAGGHPLRPLAPGVAATAVAHAVLLRRDPRVDPLPDQLSLDEQAPLRSLAHWLTVNRVTDIVTIPRRRVGRATWPTPPTRCDSPRGTASPRLSGSGARRACSTCRVCRHWRGITFAGGRSRRRGCRPRRSRSCVTGAEAALSAS